MNAGIEKTSVREGREELANVAKEIQILIESLCVLRASFATFAYGCPFTFGGAP